VLINQPVRIIFFFALTVFIRMRCNLGPDLEGPGMMETRGQASPPGGAGGVPGPYPGTVLTGALNTKPKVEAV